MVLNILKSKKAVSQIILESDFKMSIIMACYCIVANDSQLRLDIPAYLFATFEAESARITAAGRLI